MDAQDYLLVSISTAYLVSAVQIMSLVASYYSDSETYGKKYAKREYLRWLSLAQLGVGHVLGWCAGILAATYLDAMALVYRTLIHWAAT